jgi:tRNA dimethylallyltransferase
MPAAKSPLPDPPIFFIVGPTAVGKSAIAAEVATRSNCEIVNADAFQVYEGMEILTAKPGPELLQKARHHLIGIIDPKSSFDVAQYRAKATEAIAAIHEKGGFPLVVGGTGMYVRALTHGIADLPQANAEIRAELEGLPLDELLARYERLDPQGARRIDANNPRRLIRAIEVCLLTGKPFSSFRKEWERKPEHVGGVCLQMERTELYRRIDLRTEEMIHSGLLEEVRGLPELGPTASQAIGFSEAKQCLAGVISWEEAVLRIQQATRNYAKRQITWFKRESCFEPIDAQAPGVVETIASQVRAFFQS